MRLEVGATGLVTRQLPNAVKMRLDGYARAQYVAARDNDKELAVRVAKQLRVELHRLNVEHNCLLQRAEPLSAPNVSPTLLSSLPG